MRSGLIGAISAWAAISAQSVAAETCASVSFSPMTATVSNWNPIVPGSQQATFSATIRRTLPSSRSARLIFLDSNDQSVPVKLGQSSLGNGPRYEVRDSGGNNVVFGANAQVSGQNNATINLPASPSGNAVTVTYTVIVPANSGNADFLNGQYAENLSYMIECFKPGAGGSNGITGPAAGPQLSLQIPNFVSLVTASPQTLNFQNFTSTWQQLNVGLKSTGPVNVNISTLNNRRMVLSGAPAPYPDNSVIPYSILLDGTAITANPTLLTNRPRAGVAGTAWPLRLTLPGVPSGKVAGDYSDTITLTLTPGT